MNPCVVVLHAAQFTFGKENAIFVLDDEVTFRPPQSSTRFTTTRYRGCSRAWQTRGGDGGEWHS